MNRAIFPLGDYRILIDPSSLNPEPCDLVVLTNIKNFHSNLKHYSKNVVIKSSCKELEQLLLLNGFCVFSCPVDRWVPFLGFEFFFSEDGVKIGTKVEADNV